MVGLGLRCGHGLSSFCLISLSAVERCVLVVDLCILHILNNSLMSDYQFLPSVYMENLSFPYEEHFRVLPSVFANFIILGATLKVKPFSTEWHYRNFCINFSFLEANIWLLSKLLRCLSRTLVRLVNIRGCTIYGSVNDVDGLSPLSIAAIFFNILGNVLLVSLSRLFSLCILSFRLHQSLLSTGCTNLIVSFQVMHFTMHSKSSFLM